MSETGSLFDLDAAQPLAEAADILRVVESLPHEVSRVTESDNSDLPEGWTRATIGEAFLLNPGKPSVASLGGDAPVTFVPMAAVDEVSGQITAPEERPFLSVRGGYTAFAEGDVIFAKITPCMENGKAAVARNLINGIGFGSSEFHVLRSTGAVSAEYVWHFIRQESFRQAARENMTGSVGQARVPTEFLRACEIPVPPLAEQKRIVAAIEAALARVGAARERLTRVPVLLKRFRQSVLAAACSGRLTADWRDTQTGIEPASALLEHIREERKAKDGKKYKEPIPPDATDLYDLPGSWEWTYFNTVCREITVGFVGPMAKEYTETGVPFLRSLNIKPFRFDPRDIRYISRQFHERISKSTLSTGDVAVVRSGNAGTACVIPTELSEANCSDLVIVRPEGVLLPDFACLFINSPATRAYIEGEMVGIAQGHFNVGSMKMTPLPLPPLAEQREIAQRVKSLLDFADAIESRIGAATVRADRMTQAILTRAFRGELVSTEAELARLEGRVYEPASVLLSRIARHPLARRTAGGSTITPKGKKK